MGLRSLRPAPPLAPPPSNPEMQAGPHRAGAKVGVQRDLRAFTGVRSYMGARTLRPHCPQARNTHQAEGSSPELGCLGMKPRSTRHRLGTPAKSAHLPGPSLLLANWFPPQRALARKKCNDREERQEQC